MNILCITGDDQALNQQIFSVVQAAGLALPKSVHRDVEWNISLWHKRVLTSDTRLHKNLSGSEIAIGRLWEQLAGDLLLANMELPLWGWHCRDSLKLLNFWHQFDTSIVFVLVCCTPTQAVLRLLQNAANTAAEVSMEDVRTSLEEWQKQHQEMLDFYLSHADRTLLINGNDAVKNPQKMLELLASKWQIANHLNVSAVTSQTSEPLTDNLTMLLAEQLVFKADMSFDTMFEELESALHPLSEAAPSDQTQVQRVGGLNISLKLFQRLASLCNESKLQLTSLKELDEEFKQFKAKANNNVASLGKKVTDLQNNLEEKTKAEVKLSKRSNEQLAQLNAAHQQINTLEMQLSEAKKTITREKADLELVLKDEVKDLKQENELLLLQLHQVQEELERYFFDYQKVQKEKGALVDRWQNMLNHYPDYFEFRKADVKLEDSAIERARWTFTELVVGGQELAEFSFATSIENEEPVIFLPRKELEQLYNPLSKEQEEVTFRFPSTNHVKDNEEFGLESTFSVLSHSGWAMLSRLPGIILSTLKEADLKEETKDRYRVAMTGAQNIIESMPRILRFDHVELYNEQLNPDYEHVWITINNLGWGKEVAREWSVRISSDVIDGEFGGHPKLEVPKQQNQWLETWFEESRDDFGPKWELRFALPSDFDGEIWNRLNRRDQNLIKILLAEFPGILEHLEYKNKMLKRSKSDWAKLSTAMLEILEVQ